MTDETQHIDLPRVRAALGACLEAAGYEIAGDTLGLRGELYIVGDDDLARALFEFKRSAAEAAETMYQGAWVAGLPPRFAVLPSAEETSPELEMLEQFHVVPLFYTAHDVGIEFHDLDRLLEEHLAA